ncbi:MAG: T9SS type A sorting domain-containing protein [Bacteroidales bacterium]
MITVLILSFIVFDLKSQTSAIASGGVANGSNGSISYTVGQPCYKSDVGENGAIEEGIQQSYEIPLVTEIKEKEVNATVTVLLIARDNRLIISINKIEFSDLSFLIYNTNGKILHKGRITTKETTISISNYPSAPYFINVLDRNKRINTIKIVKK